MGDKKHTTSNLNHIFYPNHYSVWNNTPNALYALRNMIVNYQSFTHIPFPTFYLNTLWKPNQISMTLCISINKLLILCRLHSFFQLLALKARELGYFLTSSVLRLLSFFSMIPMLELLTASLELEKMATTT